MKIFNGFDRVLNAPMFGNVSFIYIKSCQNIIWINIILPFFWHTNQMQYCSNAIQVPLQHWCCSAAQNWWYSTILVVKTISNTGKFAEMEPSKCFLWQVGRNPYCSGQGNWWMLVETWLDTCKYLNGRTSERNSNPTQANGCRFKSHTGQHSIATSKNPSVVNTICISHSAANVINCARLCKQMWWLKKAIAEMKCKHWTKRWNWSSCTNMALSASWTHVLIAQSVRASEQNSVIVGSNPTQVNFL